MYRGKNGVYRPRSIKKSFVKKTRKKLSVRRGFTQTTETGRQRFQGEARAMSPSAKGRQGRMRSLDCGEETHVFL